MEGSVKTKETKKVGWTIRATETVLDWVKPLDMMLEFRFGHIPSASTSHNNLHIGRLLCYSLAIHTTLLSHRTPYGGFILVFGFAVLSGRHLISSQSNPSFGPSIRSHLPLFI